MFEYQEKVSACCKRDSEIVRKTKTVEPPLTSTSPQWPLFNYNNDNNNDKDNDNDNDNNNNNNNNNNDDDDDNNNDNNIYRGSPTRQGGFQWGPSCINLTN